MFRCSRSVPLPFVLCLVGLLGAPPAPAAAPPEVLVDTFSVPEIVAAARGVPFGGTLRLEGVRLDGASEALDLERFRVFSPDAEIVVHGEEGVSERFSAPDNAYFRGRIVGDSRSLAVLSVRASGDVRGIVLRADRIHTLGSEPRDGGGPARLAARTSPTGGGASEGFRCAAEGLASPAPADRSRTRSEVTAAATTSYTARVAVETDWEFFQRFGNATDATDYVGDLIGYASGVYDAEMATDLQVTELSLWNTSKDPWTQTGSLCALYELGRYWNDNRGGVERTITHFLSGKSTNAGVAWLGVLCRGGFSVNHGGACPGLSPQIDDYGGAYGFTGGIDGNFDPANPTVVWDILAVSHEIGHNFDSPHTHCYGGIGGSSQPVDECYGSQDGCYDGPASLPCSDPGNGCGTIMSYCHLLSPGLSNISLTFGTGHPYGTLPQRVPDRMRSHVESTASFDPACLERLAPCDEDLTLESDTVTGTEVHEVCGTIRAGNGYEIAPGGDVTLIAPTVILQSGFSVEGGGTLVVDAQ